MDSQGFNAQVYLGASRYEAGDYAGARVVFEALLADPTIPDLNRSYMAVNLASALTAAGTPEAEIEAAYDRGIELEKPWLRMTVSEAKVAWLISQGRAWQARDMLLHLRDQRWLTFEERDRVEATLAAVG